MTKQINPVLGYLIVFGFFGSLVAFFVYDSQLPVGRRFFKPASDWASPGEINPGTTINTPSAPPIASRIVHYSLEGNWEINAPVKYRRPNNTTFDQNYRFRLIVQKEPPNSGVVVHHEGTTLKIVGLTKNGNEFTIQSESKIFVGDVLFEGRMINDNNMEGTCHVPFTEVRNKPTSMKFTGHRVEHFDIKAND